MFKYATPPSPSGDTAAESPPPQNPWPKNAAALNEFEQRLTATTPAPPPHPEALSTALTVQEAIDTEFSTRSHSYCDGALSAAVSTGTGTGTGTAAVLPRPQHQREDSTIHRDQFQQQQHRQQVLQEETDPLRAALEDDTPGRGGSPDDVRYRAAQPLRHALRDDTVAFYRDRNTDRIALPTTTADVVAFAGDFSSGRGGAVPVAGSLLAVTNGCAAPVGVSAVDERDGDDADLEALLRRLDGRSAAIGATSAASPDLPALLLPDDDEDDDDTVAVQSTTAASTCGGGGLSTMDPTGDAASTAVSQSVTAAVSGIATDGVDATAGSHDPFAYETPPFAGPLSSYAASLEMSAAANADSEVTVNATPPPPPATRLPDGDILTTTASGAAFGDHPNERRGPLHHRLHQQRPTAAQDGGGDGDGDDIDAVLRRLDAAARRIDDTLHTDAVGRIDRFDEDWRAAQVEAGATARYDAHHERSRLSLSTRSPSSHSSSHDELHRHDAVDATSASAAPIAPPIPPNTAVEEEPTDSAPAAALEPEMSKPCRSAAVDVSLPAAVDTTAAPAANDPKELERSSSPPQEALPHPSQPPSCAASDDSGPLFLPPRREAPTVPPRRAETQVGDQHCHTDPPPPRLTKTKSPPQWSTELPTTARDVSVSPQQPTGRAESKHPELGGGRGDAVEVTEVGMAAWRYSTGRARTPQHILDGIANPPRSSSAAPTRSEPHHQPLPPTPGVSAFQSDRQRGSSGTPTSAPHAPYGTPPPATKMEESVPLGTASPVLRERLVHEDRTRKNLRRVLAATSLRAGVSPRLPHDAIPHSSASAAIGTETRTRSPPRVYASSPSTGENGVSENHPHRSPPSARPPSSLGYTPAALRDSVASTDPRLRGDHDVRDVASTGAASRYVAPSYDDSPSRPDVRSVVDGGSSERRPVRVASPLRSEFAATTVLRGNEHVPFAFARAAVEAAEFEVRLAVEGEAGAAASHLIGEERMHRAAVGLESRQRSLDAAMAAVQGRAVAQDREALLASASATVSAAAARRSASATGHAATAAGYHPSRPQQPYRDLGEGLAALGDRVLATPPVTPRTPPRYAVRLPPSSVTDQGPTMSRAGGNEKAAALADGLAPIPASFSRSVSQRNSVVPSAAVGGVGSSARHQGVVDEPFALPHASVSPHRTPPRSTPPSHPVRRGSGIRASDELLSSLSRDASPEAKATHHFGLQYAALRSRTSPPSMGGAASSVSPDRPVRTMAEAAQEFVAAAHMMAPAVSRSVSRSASRQSPEWAGAGDHAGAPAFALPTVFLTEALGHPSNPVDVDAQGRDHAGAPGGAPVTATDRTWRGDDGATADAPSRRSGHSPHRTMDTAASSCSSLGRGRLDTSRLDSYRDPTPPPRAVSAHRRAVSHSPGPRPSMPAVRGPSGGAQPTRNTRQRTPPPVATVPGSKLDEAEQWRAARNPSAAPTGHSAAASAPPLQRETQPPVRPVSVPAPQRSLPQQGTTQQSHGTHRQLQQPQQQQQQQGSVMSTASATERGRSRSGRPLPGERSSDVSRTPTGAWSPADPPLSFSGAEHSSRLHTTMTDSAPSQGPQSAQHPPHEKPPVHPTQTQQRTQQPQQQQIMSQQMESQVTRQPTEAPRSSSRFRSPSASSRASALRSPMSNDQPTSSGSVLQPQGSFVAVSASTPQQQFHTQPPQQMVEHVQPRVVMPHAAAGHRQQPAQPQHAAVQQPMALQPMVVQHQAQPVQRQAPIRVVPQQQQQLVAYQQQHQSPPQQQYVAQGDAGQGDLTANGSYAFPPDVLSSGSGVFLQQSLGPQFSSAAFSQFSGTDMDMDPFGRSVTAAHRTLSSRSLMKDGQDTVPSSRRVTVHTPSHLPPHPTGAPMGYHPPGTTVTTNSPPRHAPRRALPPSMYPPPAAVATPTRVVRVVSPGQRQRAPIVVRPAQTAAPAGAVPAAAPAPAAVPLGPSPSGAVMYSAPPRRQSLPSGGPPPPQQPLPQSVSSPRSVTQAVSNPQPEKQPQKRGHSQPRVVSPPQQPVARAASVGRAAAPPAVPSQRAPPQVWPAGSTADFHSAADLPKRPATTTTAAERSERQAVGRPPAAPRISASPPRAASRPPAVPGTRMLRHGPAVPEPTNRKLYNTVGQDSAGSEPLLPPRPVAAEAS